uniref:m7GpppX diphosphatase n=1 Tax=Ascaris lumbricoides TaxID=6252 RepID=A0A0M3I2R8_ASCLU
MVDEVDANSTGDNSLVNMKGFSFKEVLGSDSARKSAFILLDSSNGENAILLADKNAFPVDKTSWSAILTGSTLKPIMKNDIYSSYTLCMPNEFSDVKSTLIYPCNEKHIAKYRDQKRFIINETPEDYRTITLPYIQRNQMSLEVCLNGVKSTLIYPCNEKHIAKYRDQKRFIINETPEDYRTITLPYIQRNQMSLESTLIYPCNEKHIAKYRDQKRFIINETPEDYRTITLPYIQRNQMSLEWVYNILDHKAEVDRIIYEETDPHDGFILAPDLKWSGEQLECLYVQALVRRKGIKSIRDLTANDLPLLEGIRDKGLNAIKEKYGLDKHQIRAYFHYQPSFYHLHVHFIHVSYEAPASGVAKAVLLDDVINNLKLIPDFYQRSTLTFTAKEQDPLVVLFRAAKNW